MVPRADPQAMAQALGLYINDGKLRESHGKAARERAVTQFSITNMTDRYLGVYDELCQRNL